jgi:DNA repair protein REV1
MSNPVNTSQSSSDYFGEEDPHFLEALNHIPLPGDKPSSERAQSANDPIIVSDDSEDYESPPPPAQPRPKRQCSEIESEEEENVQQSNDIYGASRFGEFGEYMRRKRAKLQIQNQALEDKANNSRGIFEGVAIYVSQFFLAIQLYLNTLSLDTIGQRLDPSIYTRATKTSCGEWRGFSTLP